MWMRDKAKKWKEKKKRMKRDEKGMWEMKKRGNRPKRGEERR